MDLTRTSVSNYDVKWGSYAVGFIDKVSPGLMLKTKEIKVGSVGDVVLGERVLGLEGAIKVEIREIDAGFLKAIIPWSGTAGNASPGTSGVSIPLTPAGIHQDLYLLGKSLLIHPNKMGADTSQDLTLLIAVPRLTYLGDRDGIKDDSATVEFNCFPDRTLLPVVSYGYFGPAPG